MKPEITKDILEDLYIKQRKNYREIKALLNISNKNLIRLMKKFNLYKEPLKILEERKYRNIEKYGVDSYSKTKECKNKISNSLKQAYSTGIPQEKYKQTCLEKYGVESTSKLPEVVAKMSNSLRQTYSTGIPQEKRYQTMKNNHTLYQGGVSQREEQIYELLLTKFSSEDIIRQYKSSLYPFKCDFYIKSLDLYIEFNGGQYHYKEPFDDYNSIHIKRLNHLKQKEFEHKSIQKTQYTRMIKVWTIEDPEKRRVAKQNNLNFIELWNLEQAREFIETL